MSLPQPTYEQFPSAQLALRFARDPAGRTFLSEQFVTYPFFLTTPFALDRVPHGLATVILQSISGGMYEQEQLGLSFVAEEYTQVHVTTQSATVVHAMAEGKEANQHVSITAAAGSLVEYLPDPFVLFPTARLRSSVYVTVAEQATVVLGDAFVLHDPDQQKAQLPSLFTELIVRRPSGQLLCVDRSMLPKRSETLPFPGSLHAYQTLGTFWVLSSLLPSDFLTRLRDAGNSISGLYCGTSLLPNQAGVWMRCLAEDTIALARGFQAAWSVVRYAVTGQPPTSRRKSARY